MTRTIGYYVHHHGDGHRQRALALAASDPTRIVMLGTGLAGRTQDVRAVDLPDDRMPQSASFDGVDGTSSRPDALHYAPLDHDGVRERMGLIVQWIAEARPGLMVVDVSVEIAMLARLCATKVAFVRLSGRRDDPAHCEAYRAASVLIAPFARQLDDMTLPSWIRDKTIYCPGIVTPRSTTVTPTPRSVLVVGGKGGAAQDGALIAAAAAATPDHHWRIIGPATPPDRCPDNLVFAGWTDDPQGEIAAAEIVVGAAGDGLVNAVIAAGAPFVCCPEPRPFDEQVQKARALQAAGAALVFDQWPSTDRWPAILADALHLDRRRLTALGDPDGAANAMAALVALADGQK
ncbi:MAG: glycosyltransferase [Tardiphaga sp.]